MRTLGITSLAFAAAFAASSAKAADLPAPAKAAPPSIPFFLVNENELSYFYTTEWMSPYTGHTPTHTAEFTHFDVWKYGTNFFLVDAIKSTGSGDPVSGYTAGGVGPGATEVYALLRSTLGLNQITGSHMFSAGPLNNVSLEVGGDWNSKNNQYGPEKKNIVAGVQFNFGLPYNGHLNVAPLLYKEWNHNYYDDSLANPFGGFVPGGLVDFKPTWALEVGYSIPLPFISWIPVEFSGHVNIYGPKGYGASQIEEAAAYNPFAAAQKTVPEYHIYNKLAFDVSKYAGTQPHTLSVWVAYLYWHNMFGLNSANLINTYTTTSSPRFGVTWKF